MPANFPRGPLVPQEFFTPTPGLPLPVYCEPLTANLRLNVGVTAQGYGGATYAGQTYAGNQGLSFAPLIKIPPMPGTANLVIGTQATAKGFGGATYGGQTYAGSQGRPLLPVVTVTAKVQVTPATAVLVLATFAPTVATPRLVTPSTRALTLTTFAPDVTVSGGGAQTVTPATAPLVLTTYPPSLPEFDTAPTGSSQGGGAVIRGRVRVPRRTVGRPRRPAVPRPQRRPLVVSAAPIGDEDAILALYGAGAINESELAALLS